MTADVVAELTGACLAFGDRVLWDHLDLTVRAGEFVAVLGPNGTGKTSLLKVLLGQVPLSAGTATVAGRRVEAGSERIGYVPQHRSAKRSAVRQALHQVNGVHLAGVPVGVMSGGELQRVRIAQALATDPVLMLCDEPLLNLDPANARLVSALIDQRRREAGTAVLFVTHEVNPVLQFVDRVLYLVDGRFRVGAIDEVMTSQTLSELYRADIEVVKVGGRYVVVGEHLDHSGHASGHVHE